MFTQRCFIIKNSKELRDKVYRLGGRNGKWLNDASEIIACGHELFSCHDLDLGAEYMLVDKGYIHCGTNEELFLAIAALRDDSDIHQWFIHNNSCFDEHQSEVWHKSKSENILNDFKVNNLPNDWRKATVEELIKHYGHESI